MDADRITRTLAHLTRQEVPEFLRALDLFQRCGVVTADESAEWREAVRAKLAELSEPVAQA